MNESNPDGMKYSAVSKLTGCTEFFANFIRVDNVLDSFAIEERKQDLIEPWISLSLRQATAQ